MLMQNFGVTNKEHYGMLLLPGISRQQTIFLSDLRFSFNGSMVQSICDCSAVQSVVCLTKCLKKPWGRGWPRLFFSQEQPAILFGSHVLIFLAFFGQCKICAEIVVHRMFAVFLNGLNGKNSSRSIVRKIFSVYFFFNSRFQD